ncbi:hypothetical protein ONZ45_g2554 [Pleurotus djamor]|nr:hypothetical protein ONZ45_g2554 [Pleurotus djamor]
MLPPIATLIAFYHTLLSTMANNYSTRACHGDACDGALDGGPSEECLALFSRRNDEEGLNEACNSQDPAVQTIADGEMSDADLHIQPPLANTQLLVPFNTPTKPFKSRALSPTVTPATPSLDHSWPSIENDLSTSFDSTEDDDSLFSSPFSQLDSLPRNVGLAIHGIYKKNGQPFDGLGSLTLHGSGRRPVTPLPTPAHELSHDLSVFHRAHSTAGHSISDVALSEFYDSFSSDPYHTNALEPISEAYDARPPDSPSHDVLEVSPPPSPSPSRLLNLARTTSKQISLPHAARSFRRLSRDLSTPTVSSQLKATYRRRAATESQPAWRF